MQRGRDRTIRVVTLCAAGAALVSSGGCKHVVVLRVVEYKTPEAGAAGEAGGSGSDRHALALDRLIDALR